jgi:hypothetical protein
MPEIKATLYRTFFRPLSAIASEHFDGIASRTQEPLEILA